MKNVKICDVTDSIIEIKLFKNGHFMAFIRYLCNANNTTSVFMEYKVLMGFYALLKLGRLHDFQLITGV